MIVNVKFNYDIYPTFTPKLVAHVAFEVDDLEKALEGKKVLIQPY